MAEFFPLLGDWLWWVAAGLFLFLELLAPGIFFMWLAFAAAVTGLVDIVFDLPWQAELMIFALVAAISVYGGRRFYKGPANEPEDNPHLNKRQYNYLGKSYTLKDPIRNGLGRLSIDDTVWEIEGPDLPSGARVKVTAVDGSRLVVSAV